MEEAARATAVMVVLAIPVAAIVFAVFAVGFKNAITVFLVVGFGLAIAGFCLPFVSVFSFHVRGHDATAGGLEIIIAYVVLVVVLSGFSGGVLAATLHRKRKLPLLDEEGYMWLSRLFYTCIASIVVIIVTAVIKIKWYC